MYNIQQPSFKFYLKSNLLSNHLFSIIITIYISKSWFFFMLYVTPNILCCISTQSISTHLHLYITKWWYILDIIRILLDCMAVGHAYILFSSYQCLHPFIFLKLVLALLFVFVMRWTSISVNHLVHTDL